MYHITSLISFRRESDDFVVCLPLISISGLILYFGTQEYVYVASLGFCYLVDERLQEIVRSNTSRIEEIIYARVLRTYCINSESVREEM